MEKDIFAVVESIAHKVKEIYDFVEIFRSTILGQGYVPVHHAKSKFEVPIYS